MFKKRKHTHNRNTHEHSKAARQMKKRGGGCRSTIEKGRQACPLTSPHSTLQGQNVELGVWVGGEKRRDRERKDARLDAMARGTREANGKHSTHAASQSSRLVRFVVLEIIKKHMAVTPLCYSFTQEETCF